MASLYRKPLINKSDAEKEVKHKEKGDELIGVVISEKSIDDRNYGGTPYVVIVPERIKGDKKTHAYGSTAENAVRAAQQNKFVEPRFKGDSGNDTDTYRGIALSASTLTHPNLLKRAKPYVLCLSAGKKEGSSPREVINNTFRNKASRFFTRRSNPPSRGVVVANPAFGRRNAPAAAAPAAPAAAAPAAAPAAAAPAAAAAAAANADAPADAPAPAAANADAPVDAPADAPAPAAANADAPAAANADAPADADAADAARLAAARATAARPAPADDAAQPVIAPGDQQIPTGAVSFTNPLLAARAAAQPGPNQNSDLTRAALNVAQPARVQPVGPAPRQSDGSLAFVNPLYGRQSAAVPEPTGAPPPEDRIGRRPTPSRRGSYSRGRNTQLNAGPSTRQRGPGIFNPLRRFSNGGGRRTVKVRRKK